MYYLTILWLAYFSQLTLGLILYLRFRNVKPKIGFDPEEPIDEYYDDWLDVVLKGLLKFLWMGFNVICIIVLILMATEK